ncbi:uncharacterized protein LOC124813352 isoform X2 [Hydra vulgaris]|uniref:uncharacterized protein LOC124813352 isoform X2 n=1 Tax=Hydra vulgaris TaxID=6087 RepID=UPI0032EA1130
MTLDQRWFCIGKKSQRLQWLYMRWPNVSVLAEIYGYMFAYMYEETDGKALLSLMETMVSNLCVTMRKQVMLLEIIKNLQAPPAQQVTSIATFSAYC